MHYKWIVILYYIYIIIYIDLNMKLITNYWIFRWSSMKIEFVISPHQIRFSVILQPWKLITRFSWPLRILWGQLHPAWFSPVVRVNLISQLRNSINYKIPSMLHKIIIYVYTRYSWYIEMNGRQLESSWLDNIYTIICFS